MRVSPTSKKRSSARHAARPNRIDPRCAPLRSEFFSQSPQGCSQFFFSHFLSSSLRRAGQSIKRSPGCTSGSSMMKSIAGLSGSAQSPPNSPPALSRARLTESLWKSAPSICVVARRDHCLSHICEPAFSQIRSAPYQRQERRAGRRFASCPGMWRCVMPTTL